jgi:pilus assembly protein CpaF
VSKTNGGSAATAPVAAGWGGRNGVEGEFIPLGVIKRAVRDRVYAEIDPPELLARLRRDPLGVREELAALVLEIVTNEGYLLTEGRRRELQAYIIDEILGYGPIEPFLKDAEVEEIMVNKADEVWIVRRRHATAKMELTRVGFDDDEHVLHVVDRIIGPIGRRVDESNPRVDARLPDGSRINVVIPPLALDGPTVTIRKFPEKFLTMDDLIHQFGSITEEVAEFLRICVEGRLNVIISGGTGSGKTTLLNALSAYIPDRERIVTIEDTAELQLHRYKPHVVRLESRPPNIEGKGAVTIRDLVVNSLRMRPDRIVVGECRAGETVDMLQAMNTGHDGSLTTVHANSPEEAAFRIENMFLMSGLEVPVAAIRQQIGMAIQLIVQQRRMGDGTRKITHITQVTGVQDGKVHTEDLFSFENGRLVDQGHVIRHIGKLKMNLNRLAPLGIFDRSLDWLETQDQNAVAL